MAVEAELQGQKQVIECNAQKLKIREELAKARAKVSAYDEVKPVNFEEAIIMPHYKATRISSLIMMTDITDTIPWKEKNFINTWNFSTLRGHCKKELRQKPIIKKSVQL